MAMISTPLPMAPMFIPRAVNSCSAPYASCSSDGDTNTGLDPSLMEKQGPHRFIGVAMVVGLILIIFLVWLYRGRWPRKMLQQYCCCCGRSEELPKPIDDEIDNNETPPIQTTSAEEDKSTPRDSELVKEVSAGMVVFTKVPKALRSKERHHHPVEWEMDHVNGIRLEVPNLVIAFILHVLIGVFIRHELHLTMRGMAVDKAKFELL